MHSGMQFTTRDADHDTLSSGNCAQERHGAWWYTGCTHSNLNGRYKDSRQWGYDGMFWHTLDGYYSLKFAEMKMRPL
ncbi:hypothetical protein V1264_024492 [Littorina saxatilis]|uniref:Fibrinogen C-terminal domain-containing protein n=1 Tax=Littorina saxatilis TaxID=31220 RepID=A0AAN9AL65_9CAEN